MSLAFRAPVVLSQRLSFTFTSTCSRRSSFFSPVWFPSSITRRFRSSNQFQMSNSNSTDANGQSDPLSHGYQYDLFVIGAGSGGVRAARISAKHGARVACAERGPLGGTCVNVGCVPKKLFVYGSHYGHDIEDAQSYGWDIPKASINWPRLISNKNEEIERLNGVYEKLLNNAGVKLVRGTAKFVDPHTIDVDGTEYTAKTILIATGGYPFVPDFEGNEHVISSNEAFYLSELPKRIIIVGGGYIAVEFACIFHGYGVEVTQFYRRDLFLRGFDYDLRSHLASQMREQGIDLRFNTDVSKIVKNSDGTFTVTTKDGDTVETDAVMFATGRMPNVKAMCLDKAGVKTEDNGKVIVDDWHKTNVDHIYAIGDVIDRVQLTPVAIAEGHAFADTMYGNKKRNINYEYIPTAVFSSPNIGTCGLTESEAREKFGKHGVDVYKTSFSPMKHSMTKRKGEKVLMKLVVERETDKIVGCHMLDSSAGEVIQLVGVAMKAGVTKEDFDSTMPVHPVSAEEIVTLREKEPDPEDQDE